MPLSKFFCALSWAFQHYPCKIVEKRGKRQNFNDLDKYYKTKKNFTIDWFEENEQWTKCFDFTIFHIDIYIEYLQQKMSQHFTYLVISTFTVGWMASFEIPISVLTILAHFTSSHILSNKLGPISTGKRTLCTVLIPGRTGHRHVVGII